MQAQLVASFQAAAAAPAAAFLSHFFSLGVRSTTLGGNALHFFYLRHEASYSLHVRRYDAAIFHFPRCTEVIERLEKPGPRFSASFSPVRRLNKAEGE